jgi:protein tyrosine phosphatase (PTP) superfamily phosphohydrolase (DUF442 family)
MDMADSSVRPAQRCVEAGVVQPVSVHLVEAERDIEGGCGNLLVLASQVIKQLIRGDSQLPHPTFQEVARQRGLRRHHQIRWIGPSANFPKEGAYPAEILLVRPFLRPYLGYREAEHVCKVRGETCSLPAMPTPLQALGGLANACQLLPNVVTGGQPNAAQLRALQEAGGGIVLDLRDPMEPRLVEEPALVRELGMEYVNIPVRAGSLDDATLERILSVLRGAGDRTVFVHCGSGNRVGGALIPYLILDQGMDEQDAVEQAMRVGLRSAEIMEWGLDYARRNQPLSEP